MKRFYARTRIVADGSVQEFRAVEHFDPGDEDPDEEWEAPDLESAADDALEADPFDDDEPLPERGDFWADPDEWADNAD